MAQPQREDSPGAVAGASAQARASFLALTELHSAQEVSEYFESHPDLDDPELETLLLQMETEWRQAGADTGSLANWRLVWRSLREGRNLRQSFNEFLEADSLREARDVIAAESLLLDPEVDGLFLAPIRALQQRGADELARGLKAKRRTLAVFRERGLKDGYFELLTQSILYAPQEFEKSLADDHQLERVAYTEFALREIKLAESAGDMQRLQGLMYVNARLRAASFEQAEAPAVPADRDPWISLPNIFVARQAPDAQHQQLRAFPELLMDRSMVLTTIGLVQGEMQKARVELEVTRVRELWLSKRLLARAADAKTTPGATRAEQVEWIDSVLADLESGRLWPSPNETI